MPRYLISFDDGSMDHIPEEDWPMVGEASHAVVREIKQAGAWIFGAGVLRQQASIVALARLGAAVIAPRLVPAEAAGGSPGVVPDVARSLARRRDACLYSAIASISGDGS